MTLRLARLWLTTGLFAAAPALFGQASSPSVARPGTAPQLVPAAPAKAAPAPIQFTPRKGDEMVDSFKLADGDIDSVLASLERLTGRTVLRPGTLPTQTYTLTISRPIPKTELITALETILELGNVSVSPMGDRFLKVTNLSQAKSESPEMITGSSLDLEPSGKIVTKIFELNFLRVSEFVPQILSFMTPNVGGGVVSLDKANVIMVTDSLENIQRVERLLLEVDHPREGSLTPKFYTLHNGAKASDVVQKIHAMITGPAATSMRATTTFTSDDRTNQIILIADPREYPLFDSLIEQMDIKSDPVTRMEVIPLKHGDSKDVAALLTALISGQNTASQKSQSNSVRPTTPGQAAAATPAVATPTAAASDSLASSEFSNFITVQPDERTNSVVVSGTVDDIRLIRAIVDKIDVLLAQVRIEVVIAEVTLNDTTNSGISSAALNIGPAPNGGTSITNLSASLAGLGISPTAGVVNDVNPVNILANLTSLGDISRSKILQQSTIVTTHNKEAMITVTDQLPVITGSTSEPLGTGTTVSSPSFAQSSSVTYKDIGITLKVTPLIGDDGSIQLKIDQVVDNQGPSVTIDGNSQPSINHREATSFLNVMNDELIVLGGFQSSTKTIDRSKTGIIFEIPIISNLLGYRTNDTQRSELLLFLRPHILQPSEGTADTKRAINGMANKEQINKFLQNPSRIPDAKMSLKENLE